MMNKIIYLIAMILFAACSSDDNYIIDANVPNDEVQLSFLINVPAINTKASFNENAINELTLLAFDQAGSFIARKSVALSGNTLKVSVPKSARIFHFIANHDWTGFVDSEKINKSEKEIIPALTTQNAVFWCRYVWNGSPLTGIQVDLLRSFSKTSLTNATTQTVLKDISFKVYNMANRGTVAPFRTTDGSFVQDELTEPAGMTTETSQTFGTDPVYFFERNNKTATNRMFLIVRGKFNNELNYTYYKIDLIDSNNTPLPVLRNYHYKVNLLAVSKSGRVLEADAASAPADNNISASVELEKYPSISDGLNSLTVQNTLFVYTASGSLLNIKADYRVISTQALDNSKISIQVQLENSLKPVFSGNITYNPTTGMISATLLSPPTSDEEYRAIITVRAGVLQRQIQVILRRPYNFQNVSITPNRVTIVGTEVSLNFTVPGNLPEMFFPMVVKIYAKKIYPTTPGVEIAFENKDYYYLYNVMNAGSYNLKFKTNVSNSAETITLKAVNFNSSTASFVN